MAVRLRSFLDPRSRRIDRATGDRRRPECRHHRERLRHPNAGVLGMSNGTPPIETAPVPPSIAGIPQPVFGSGSATVPATNVPITGSPILPPPLITNPPGTPVFPPVTPNTAPVPVPVGPLVGPAVGPAPVPPSIPGVTQPQFVPPGTAHLPATLFPGYFTTTPPSPPIVFANIFKIGTVPPPLPSTPGQTPPAIIPSPVPTIPQLPWNPNPL